MQASSNLTLVRNGWRAKGGINRFSRQPKGVNDGVIIRNKPHFETQPRWISELLQNMGLGQGRLGK